MDFWLQDDDDNVVASQHSHSSQARGGGGGGGCLSQQSQQSQQQSQQSQQSQVTKTKLTCHNCENDVFEEDETTGKQVCTNCFTEAQTLSQVSHDYEDVMGLAARQGGKFQIASQPTHKKAGNFTFKEKLPLEPLNTAQPLPSTALCVQGMQCVLYRSIKCVANNILKCQPPTDKTLLLDMAKRYWIAYLRAWHAGAEYYGRKAPTVRLAFRDVFFTPTQRAGLYRVLARDAWQKVKQQHHQQQEEEDSEIDKNNKTQSAGTTQHLSNPKHRHRTTTTKTTTTTTTTAMPSQSSSLYTLPTHFTQGQTRGSREAALVMPPTLTAIVALVYVVLQQSALTTMTAGTCLDWIRQHGDAWPILTHGGAYHRLLTRKLQHELLAVKSWFMHVGALPPVSTIESMARLWLIIGGNPVDERQKPSTSTTTADAAIAATTATTDPAVVVALPCLLPIENIPILLAQRVADLRLGQDVLQTALALVGLLNNNKNNKNNNQPTEQEALEPWQETRNRCYPVLIHAPAVTETIHVHAILTCAAILVHGSKPLQTWRRNHNATQIPWTDHDCATLTRAQADHYVETFVHPVSESLIPEFTDLLQPQPHQWRLKLQDHDNNIDKDDDDEDGTLQRNRVRACPVAVLGPRPGQVGNEPLRGLILAVLKQRRANRIYKKKNRPSLSWPSLLGTNERLWMEVIASDSHVSYTALVQAMHYVLLDDRPDNRKAKRRKRSTKNNDQTQETKQNQPESSDDDDNDDGGGGGEGESDDSSREHDDDDDSLQYGQRVMV